MNKPSIELSDIERIVIQGFEREDIDVCVEELELKIAPESSAGFLE
jgi:hypothetical protein